MARSTTSGSRRAATAAVASITALLVFAGCASDPPSRDRMREFYELSGLAARVADTAELVSQGIAQQRDRIDAEALASAEQGIRRAYAPEALERAVLRELNARWQAKHAEAALHWLRSPHGRGISGRAAAAASPRRARVLEEFARELQADPPPEARLAQARRFEAATNGAGFLVDLTLTTSLGIALALNATLPEEQRADQADVGSAIEERRDGLRAMLGPMASIAFLYSVRELSDAEVARALAFAESRAGRWYAGAVSRAYLEALAAASRGIAEPRRE